MLSKKYERFGIHNCNWDITPYIKVYRSIKKMGYVNMGINSDMKRAIEVFCDVRRAILYSPAVAIEKKPVDEIRKDIEKIYNELAPCDIVLADIVENNTPDLKVIKIINMIRQISEIDKDETSNNDRK